MYVLYLKDNNDDVVDANDHHEVDDNDVDDDDVDDVDAVDGRNTF